MKYKLDLYQIWSAEFTGNRWENTGQQTFSIMTEAEIKKTVNGKNTLILCEKIVEFDNQLKEAMTDLSRETTKHSLVEKMSEYERKVLGHELSEIKINMERLNNKIDRINRTLNRLVENPRNSHPNGPLISFKWEYRKMPWRDRTELEIFMK